MSELASDPGNPCGDAVGQLDDRGRPWRSSVALYDSLADSYDDHFAVPHRAAYDELAWEAVVARLPTDPGVVIDAGCGSGRWSRRFLDLGHRVIGIEQAPAMVAAAHRRIGASADFRLVDGDMATVESRVLVPGEAALVVAMGSVQYTPDPRATIARLARWARPGATVAVLVDSLAALVLELTAGGRADEAGERGRTGRGVWTAGGRSADVHLFDRTTLGDALRAAGLVDVEVRGLLVGASALGRVGLTAALAADRAAVIARERQLSLVPALADTGKQLLALGLRPAEH